MSPRTHVGRRLLPPIFLPNIGHNQSASGIIALTFLTKNVSNESAFFVQREHPYRAFLRTHTRTNIRVSLAPTESSYSSNGSQSSYGSHGAQSFLQLRLESFSSSDGEFLRLSRCLEFPQLSQSVYSSQLVSLFQSVSSSHSVKSDGRGQAVDVYSVDSIQSKSDLINRYVYYDPRVFIYQIGSQNLNKIKAIPILSDVTSVCDYTKLLENI